MVSIQLSQARTLAGFVAVSVVLTGCGMFGHGRDTSSRPAPTRTSSVSTDTAQAAPEEDATATEAAIETAPAPAQSASTGPDASIIRPDAPKTYTVKPGDTLWGVASMFLKDAYLWPEVWIINPQVKNPHLIYPGDTLALAYGANGRPQISLQSGGAARLNPRLRSSGLDGAIPTIPYSSISAFLSKPAVLSKDQIRDAPQVLAFREKHMIGGSGNEIYIKNLNAPVNSRFSVVHVGEALR